MPCPPPFHALPGIFQAATIGLLTRAFPLPTVAEWTGQDEKYYKKEEKVAKNVKFSNEKL